MMIYRHKKTGRLLLLINWHGKVARLYLLDTNRKKILAAKKNGNPVYDTNGNLRYETAVCGAVNLEVV